MFEFPAFRSEAWIQQLIGSLFCPSEVLANADLTPAYMASNPSAALYKSKANEAKEQIRRALFRHSLFKIQNVEVTDSSCRIDRVVKSIALASSGSLSGLIMDVLAKDKESTFFREEIWTVDRCGTDHQYAVRYYREGADGFSSRVVPLGLMDKIAMMRFYFS